MKKIFFIPFLFILISCSGKEEESGNSSEPAGIYSYQKIDDSQLSEIIKNRNGKALFINVWATWCVPCVEEFPDLVRTYNHFREADVEFISLNVDSDPNLDSLLIPFLRKYQAEFPVYNISDRHAENVINLLNSEWNGAIPATFIYSRQGEQKVFLLGAENFLKFRTAIDSVRSL